MTNLTKSEIRQQMLQRRKAISHSDRALAELDIEYKLLKEILGSAFDKKQSFVALYQSIGAEVDTTHLAAELTRCNYQIAYPDVLGEGLMEFKADATGETIEPEQIGIMVVPLVAFDGNGNRLGRGGGYYDRYLPRLSQDTPTIGLAYDAQLVKELPTEPHDVALFAIITPNLVYSRKAS